MKSTRNDAKVMDLYGYTHTQPVRTYRPQIETKNQKSTSDFPKFRKNIPRSAKPEIFIKNCRETVEITAIVFFSTCVGFLDLCRGSFVNGVLTLIILGCSELIDSRYTEIKQNPPIYCNKTNWKLTKVVNQLESRSGNLF